MIDSIKQKREQIKEQVDYTIELIIEETRKKTAEEIIKLIKKRTKTVYFENRDTNSAVRFFSKWIRSDIKKEFLGGDHDKK